MIALANIVLQRLEFMDHKISEIFGNLLKLYTRPVLKNEKEFEIKNVQMIFLVFYAAHK